MIQSQGGMGHIGAMQAGAAALAGLQGQQAYAANQQARKPALLADSNRLIERLIEVSAKVERFAAMLCGNAPSPLNGKNEAAGAPVEPNLQLNLDTAAAWVDRIEAHLARIGNGL